MDNSIDKILEKYYYSFQEKQYGPENDETDVLMSIYDITPNQKRENRQYWGRELGMIWQTVVIEIARQYGQNYQPALRIKNDEPCDLRLGQDAIDTKYRIGSGDSGTLKKFKQYGKLLRNCGYRPVLLILRDDNLPAAIRACTYGGWTVYTGEQAFRYMQMNTGVDLYKILKEKEHEYSLKK